MKKEETYFHASNIIQTEEVVFMHLGMYPCLYICIFYISTINGKRGHEFERHHRKVNERVWRKERVGGNYAIMF